MKFIALLSTMAATTYAAATTNRDCYEDDEVTHLGDCRSLWYKICDSYEIAPTATCNFVTFGDASINWFSDSIEVFVWNYIMKASDDDTAGDSGSWSLRQARTCQPESLANEVYTSEQRLQARQQNCGFKFQVTNLSEYGTYDFTLLRNSASFVTAGAVAFAATIALF